MTVFITVILGLTFFQALTTNISENTRLSYENESIAIVTGIGQTSYDDITSVSGFGNSTNTTDSSVINLGTDVNFTSAGVITVGQNITNDVNGSLFSDGNYDIAYNFEGDNYVGHSTARTLLLLVSLFFALTIMFTGVYGFKKLFPDKF